jgi:hypothetical protein
VTLEISSAKAQAPVVSGGEVVQIGFLMANYFMNIKLKSINTLKIVTMV